MDAEQAPAGRYKVTIALEVFFGGTSPIQRYTLHSHLNNRSLPETCFVFCVLLCANAIRSSKAQEGHVFCWLQE